MSDPKLSDPKLSNPKWFTSADGLQIAYDDSGPAAASGPSESELPPVVLHHGFAASSYLNWVAPGVVAALVAAGRRVVSIDARGHGRSDKPHDPTFYGETKMARDVSTLVDTLGMSEFDLVGYSMGAIVSLVVASQEPHVRRLVVGGIGGAVAERGGVDTKVIGLKELAGAMLADDPTTVTDPAAARFRALAASTGADLKALAAQAMSARQESISFDRISAPALVLVGRDDDLGKRPEVLAKAIPHAELRVIGGNHLSAVADPDFAPAIIEFIGR